jgi:glycine cleavage system aminomethyltransferase T
MAMRWRALMQAGSAFGVTPYGTEALGVMRIEKGHVAGNELNGQTTARRSRPWQDDVDEEGLYRPPHGRARGAGPEGARLHV